MLLAAVALGATATQAHAADATVDPCTESALRQAIAAAPAGGTVDFGCEGEIAIQSGSPVEILKDLTLDASGRQVSINGLGRTQIFFLSGGGQVTMRGLTLKGGNVSDPGAPNGGGAVFAANTTFAADSMRFVGNYSENQGGAVSTFGTFGGLMITDSEFLGNSVGCGNICANGGGGAIVHNGGRPAVIERTTFRENSMIGLGAGGAVLAKFTFQDNRTGPLTVVDSVFEQNVANVLDLDPNVPSRGGGAIAAFNHPLTIQGSSFVENLAIAANGISARGGAVNIGGRDDLFPFKPASISDSTFVGNRVGGQGTFGGAVHSGLPPTEIVRSTIRGNEADNGGGVASFGALTVTDSRLLENTARGSVNGTGGGIWSAEAAAVSGQVATISGTDVIGNDPDGCFGSPPAEIVDAGDNFESPTSSCGFAAIDRPALAIDDIQLREPSAGQTARAAFSLTLSEPLAWPLRVAYVTEDGSAAAGEDYVAEAGELTIPAGGTSAQVPVEALGDDAAEGDQNFFLQLSLPEPGRTTMAGGGRGTATIVEASGGGTGGEPDTPPGGEPDTPPTPEPTGPPVGWIDVMQSKLMRKIKANFSCDRPCEARLDLFRRDDRLASEGETIHRAGDVEDARFKLRRKDLEKLREKVDEKGSVKLTIQAHFSNADGSTEAKSVFRLD